MIQKRYKNTPELQQAKGLKALIESQKVVLAEIELPDMVINGVTHKQSLVVRNLNIAISINYVKITPERVLTNQDTCLELKGLNLFVPDWTITNENVSSHIGADGQRIYYEMEYFDDETNEVVTQHLVTKDIFDENDNPTTEEVLEDLELLTPEIFYMPTIPYLGFFITQTNLPDLIDTFSHQFVSDNIEVWNTLA